MPKYRDKIRLKEILRKGDVGPLRRYLVLEEYPNDVVEDGLEYFVKRWEKMVE